MLRRHQVVKFPRIRVIRQSKLAAYLDALRSVEAALRVYENLSESLWQDIREGAPVEDGPLMLRKKRGRLMVDRAAG